MDHAFANQLISNVLGKIAGNGQSHSLKSTGAALDRGIDPDHFSFQVDKWAAAVAWVDGGIGLQVVFVNRSFRVQTAPAFRAHDSRSNRSGQAKRRANCQYPVTDFHSIAIAEFQIG